MMDGKWVTCYDCTGMGKISSAVACKNCDGHGGWSIDFELLAAAPDMAARIAELEEQLDNEERQRKRAMLAVAIQAERIAELEQRLAKLHELGKWHKKMIGKRDNKIIEFHQSNERLSRRIAELEAAIKVLLSVLKSDAAPLDFWANAIENAEQALADAATEPE